MKILFVTPHLCYPEVPYAGGMATFKIMERLASRGHELFLITGLRPGEKEHLDEVKYFCTVLDAIEIPWSKGEVAKAVIQWIFHGGKGGLTFRSKCALAIDKFSKQIRFDIIQVEHTELGDCIKGPMDVPTIIDAHDVILKPALREYKLATGMRKAVKYIKFRMVRKRNSTYRRFTKVFVRSEFDRNLLLSYRGGFGCFHPPGVRKNRGLQRESRHPGAGHAALCRRNEQACEH